MSYQLFTDATADFCPTMFEGLPKPEVIPMEVFIEDTTYLYSPKGNFSIEEFYTLQQAGKFASTSQISPATYKSFWEPHLKKGQDILYLGFSSGMSGTMNSAQISAQELMNDYPMRTIRCVDTLCASVGEGFLVREAAIKQAEGMELESLAQWVEKYCLKVCHWFTIDSFKHLLHGGRVSPAAAMVGSVLNIKPLLHVDTEGKLKVVEKPRGHKQAMRTKIEHLKQGWLPEIGKLIVIGHENDEEHGKQIYNEVKNQFPDAEVYLTAIGPVIGSHTGSGTIALIYWGSNR